MISVHQCKQLIDQDLTDEEIERIRVAFYETAQLACEIYWSDKDTGSKNPIGLLSSSNEVDTI